jgi:RHS repeat-associated protein
MSRLADGRLSSRTVDGQTTSYAYDEVGQLLTETRGGVATAYTYDGNHNRLTRSVGGSVVETYAYSDDDRLLSVTSSAGVRSFDYDNAGRTTAERWQGAVVKTYAWNADDRLVTATGAFGSRSYGYSFSGARASETGGQGRTWLRRGTGVTSPVLRDGVSRYSPGSSVRPLAGGDSAFQHGGWKSFEAQTGPTGTVTGTRQFDAFGAQVASTGSWQGALAHGGGYGYQSDDTGLQLLGHRYYDPSTGRFLTRDPIKDGPNWYAYCLNDPVNAADPTGLWFAQAYENAGNWIDQTFFYGLSSNAGDAWGRAESGTGSWWEAGSKTGLLVVLVVASGVSIAVGAASGVLRGAGGAARGLADDAVEAVTKGACFVAGTRILLADGSTKPIEEVKAGDKVMSRPEGGGPLVEATVARTFVHEAPKTLLLTFDDGSKVETTEEHPFHVPGKGWTEAGNLRAGVSVASLGGPGLAAASTIGIASVRVLDRQTRVYNFKVAGTHTYYVASDQSAKWVHNKAATDEVLEGVYFGVHKETGKTYVGQSGNLLDRPFRGHLDTSQEIQFIIVRGGKEARERVEQEIIDSLGGIGDPGLANKRNPIGRRRR